VRNTPGIFILDLLDILGVYLIHYPRMRDFGCLLAKLDTPALVREIGFERWD